MFSLQDQKRIFILTTPNQYNTGSPSQLNKARRKKKKGKQEITVLFTNNINVYVENPKPSTEKLPEAVSFIKSQNRLTYKSQ